MFSNTASFQCFLATKTCIKRCIKHSPYSSSIETHNENMNLIVNSGTSYTCAHTYTREICFYKYCVKLSLIVVKTGKNYLKAVIYRCLYKIL